MELLNAFRNVKEDIKEIHDNDELKAIGFDSLSIMKLVFELEEHYHIHINDDELSPKYFSTVAGVKELINKHLNNN